MGIAEHFDVDADIWKQRLLKKLNAAGITLEDFQSGVVKSPFTHDVLFAERKFQTPSGRVNLIHELDPQLLNVPTESRLCVTAVSTGKAQASQWPSDTQIGPIDAVVHSSAAPNHRDGDVVTVTTDRASLQVRLRFSENQRPDVLLMEKGGWHFAARSANSLIHAELTDDGECAVYYDTPAVIS